MRNFLNHLIYFQFILTNVLIVDCLKVKRESINQRYIVEIHQNSTTYDRLICTGAIISQKLIIAAMHCVIKSDGETIYITSALGDHRVESIDCYPNSTISWILNDICIIHLLDLLPIGYSIALTNQNFEPATRLTVHGFERKHEIINLVTSTIELQDDDNCINLYQESYRSELMYCGKVIGKKNVCNFSEQSGIVVHDDFKILTGVASWVGQCYADQPAVYLNLFYFIDWVRVELEKNLDN